LWPLGTITKRGRSSIFKCVAAERVAFLIERVVEFGAVGAEVMQLPHLIEPQHGPFSLSEGQM
jgi:hypothetical protein